MRSALRLAVLAALAAPTSCSLLAEPCDAEHPCGDDRHCSARGVCEPGGVPVDDAGAARDDAGFVDDGGALPADAGFADAGFADAGFADAGFADAGFVDAGFVDAGFVDAGFVDAGDAGDAGDLAFVDLEPNLDAGPYQHADGGVYASRCPDGADAGAPCATDCSNFFWGVIQDDAVACAVMQPAPATGACDVDGNCVLDADALDACADLGPGLVLASCDALCARPDPVCVRGLATSFFGVRDLCVVDAGSALCDDTRCVEDEGLGLTSVLRCDGLGVCNFATTGTCGDYKCADEFTCAEACEEPSDCVGGAPCDGGTCVTFAE